LESATTNITYMLMVLTVICMISVQLSFGRRLKAAVDEKLSRLFGTDPLKKKGDRKVVDQDQMKGRTKNDIEPSQGREPYGYSSTASLGRIR